MQNFLAAVSAATDIATMQAICLFIIGAGGALIRDITDDDGLQLPSINQGKFYAGFFGGALVGGVAGLLSGDSFIGALTAGFMGYSVILTALGGRTPEKEKEPETIQALIQRIAEKNKTDVKLAMAVAEAESSFNPKAEHKNADGSTDRGLYQINSKWHPEVSETQAYDPEFATEFFCKAVKNGNLSWWNSSKPRWIEKVYS